MSDAPSTGLERLLPLPSPVIVAVDKNCGKMQDIDMFLFPAETDWGQAADEVYRRHFADVPRAWFDDRIMADNRRPEVVQFEDPTPPVVSDEMVLLCSCTWAVGMSVWTVEAYLRQVALNEDYQYHAMVSALKLPGQSATVHEPFNGEETVVLVPRSMIHPDTRIEV